MKNKVPLNKYRDRDYWESTWISFKNGDRDSFERIYNEFVDVLFTYGIKICNDHELVKDAIQDLFVDLYRYNITLKNPEYLEFYLVKSLKRQIISRIKVNHKSEMLSEISEYTFQMKFDLEEDYTSNETENLRIQSVKELLLTLDPPKREILFLKFNTGLNYLEIGQLLNLKPDTVKKQIYRLLGHLRQKYGNKLMELFFISFKKANC